MTWCPCAPASTFRSNARRGAGAREVAMGHGLELLSDPVAERLLASTYPARLAYNWTDGTPRVIPICFHWDGSALHFGTQPHAPKIRALSANPQVAVTIDSVTFPYDVLLLRGSVAIEVQDDVVPEYAL